MACTCTYKSILYRLDLKASRLVASITFDDNEFQMLLKPQVSIPSSHGLSKIDLSSFCKVYHF